VAKRNLRFSLFFKDDGSLSNCFLVTSGSRKEYVSSSLSISVRLIMFSPVTGGGLLLFYGLWEKLLVRGFGQLTQSFGNPSGRDFTSHNPIDRLPRYLEHSGNISLAKIGPKEHYFPLDLKLTAFDRFIFHLLALLCRSRKKSADVGIEDLGYFFEPIIRGGIIDYLGQAETAYRRIKFLPQGVKDESFKVELPPEKVFIDYSYCFCFTHCLLTLFWLFVNLVKGADTTVVVFCQELFTTFIVFKELNYGMESRAVLQ